MENKRIERDKNFEFETPNIYKIVMVILASSFCGPVPEVSNEHLKRVSKIE